MTKQERQAFEDLVRMVATRWCPYDNYDVDEEWEEFYRIVFRLNPGSEVMMRYEGSLYDLCMGR